MEWSTPEQREGPWSERCRCDGFPMNGSDHCGQCFCERFEERCSWSQPWQERSDSEKFGELMRMRR